MLIPVLLLMLAPQDAAAANDADLKCMALFSIATAGAAAEQQSSLIAGTMFYYGKLYGRSPTFDVESALLRLSQADPDGKKLEADRARCGEEIQKHGTSLIDMGKRISAAAGQ